MRVTFNIIGWRDPSYSSNSADGYGEWNEPITSTAELTKEEVAELDEYGFITVNNKNICVDYDTLAKLTVGNYISYNYCVVFISKNH